MNAVWWLIKRCRNEIRIVLTVLIVLITLPIASIVVFASSGLEIVSEALATINSVTHLVEVKDPNGNVIKTIEATTVWPVCGIITNEFGVPDLPAELHHTGIDIANDYRQIGSPVTTFMTGTVTQVIDSSAGFGRHVVIDHGNSISSLYGHLSELKVAKGQQVKPGDVIGLEGSTGWSSGPHVHFTTMISSIPVNPHVFMIGEPVRCRL